MKNYKIISLALTLMLTSFQSMANLSEADLEHDGDKLITIDNTSGLAWLDLSLTWGVTPESLINGSAPRNLLSEGWRIATAEEFIDLIKNVTQLPWSQCYSSSDTDPYCHFVNGSLGKYWQSGSYPYAVSGINDLVQNLRLAG